MIMIETSKLNDQSGFGSIGYGFEAIAQAMAKYLGMGFDDLR
jgi:hypothetical protein